MVLKVPALWISPDEPCFTLAEVNLQSPGSRGWRRYQVVYVVRNDRLAEHQIDLGPAKKFKADQFRIPGGVQDKKTGHVEIVHTVGELQDMADYMRAQTPWRAIEPDVRWDEVLGR
jgi:hypothetical protein